MKTNPLKEERLRRNLTQRKLASLAQVSTNAIVKYEHGLYLEPSEKILQALFDYEHLGPASFDYYLNVLRIKYRVWRYETRIAACSALRGAGNFVYGTELEHPVVVWRKRLGFDSQMEFCKLLVLHPSIVSQYECGRTRSMPDELVNALTTARVSTELIEYLDAKGEQFHDRRI